MAPSQAQLSPNRAPAAVDLLAAIPLLSATSLARALGIAIKNAGAILVLLASNASIPCKCSK